MSQPTSLLALFYQVKEGTIDIPIVKAFFDWKVYIIDGEIGILDEKKNKLAYCPCNTKSLNRKHKYTIYISKDTPYIYIESGINMPTMIQLTKKTPMLPISDTPNPTQLVGKYYLNYSHTIV